MNDIALMAIMLCLIPVVLIVVILRRSWRTTENADGLLIEQAARNGIREIRSDVRGMGDGTPGTIGLSGDPRPPR